MFVDDAVKNYPAQLRQYEKAAGKHEVKTKEYQARLQAFINRGPESKMKKPRAPNKLIKPVQPRMRPEESHNFLLLAEALTILLSPSITRRDLDRGDRLLRQYIAGFKKVCCVS